ncbi:hypothetical protein BO86DRAFT_77163 [Aspergillus japonicus CBS 114.51]|uniref:Uncharacterized protein n=1 Tax=Aspergillus japonicus CBS 114.51 TaxID=1448312 RepID=A0A8T8XI34_ASPJA|nr:hypothetical protein BO86DRAFT_77163 [Aspergillus japonicus CBS 114.51]RAH87062.1 hypothetical protein BO86DRAFT_77163 [Aspergillus japonicus CBS 114.51]
MVLDYVVVGWLIDHAYTVYGLLAAYCIDRERPIRCGIGETSMLCWLQVSRWTRCFVRWGPFIHVWGPGWGRLGWLHLDLNGLVSAPAPWRLSPVVYCPAYLPTCPVLRVGAACTVLMCRVVEVNARREGFIVGMEIRWSWRGGSWGFIYARRYNYGVTCLIGGYMCLSLVVALWG